MQLGTFYSREGESPFVSQPLKCVGWNLQRDSIYDRNVKSDALLIAQIHGYIQSCEWNDKSVNRERESRMRIGSDATFF